MARPMIPDKYIRERVDFRIERWKKRLLRKIARERGTTVPKMFESLANREIEKEDR